MIKTSLFIFCLLFAPCGIAAELFGVQLPSATLDQLRTAVKQSGATLIRESGEGQPYDIYNSKALLAESSRLYLGYTGEDRRFAFVEYEFIGLQQSGMIQKLNARYGQPEIQKGQYISDRSYQWVVNGIQISLQGDWQNYRTRLIYADSVAVTKMKQLSHTASTETANVNSTNY